MAQRTCTEPDCGKPHVAQGLCRTHYSQQWRATGHRRPRTFEARFEANIRKSDGCWEWTGAHANGGYGLIIRDKQRLRAHRVAYELAYGPIPEGLVVRHKCDNPPCVNPEHLELGTQADNGRDREERGRGYWANRTHCAKGHPFEGDNLYVNPGGFRQCRICVRTAGIEYKRKQRAANPPKYPHLTLEQHAAIVELAATGAFTQRELADRFGCTQPTISAIVNGKRKRGAAH